MSNNLFKLETLKNLEENKLFYLVKKQLAKNNVYDFTHFTISKLFTLDNKVTIYFKKNKRFWIFLDFERNLIMGPRVLVNKKIINYILKSIILKTIGESND